MPDFGLRRAQSSREFSRAAAAGFPQPNSPKTAPFRRKGAVFDSRTRRRPVLFLLNRATTSPRLVPLMRSADQKTLRAPKPPPMPPDRKAICIRILEPLGRPTIAPRFIVGKIGDRAPRVPAGTTEFWLPAMQRVCRPCRGLTIIFRILHPTMNRWAILFRPKGSGTDSDAGCHAHGFAWACLGTPNGFACPRRAVGMAPEK